MDLVRFIQVEVVVDDDDVEPRCKRQRKEPSCVVGEHKHEPFGMPLSLVGDVEILSLLWDSDLDAMDDNWWWWWRWWMIGKLKL